MITGLSQGGYRINAEDDQPPIYATRSYFTEENGTTIKVEFSGELKFLIRDDDPTHPIDGQIWLRRT